MNAASSKKTLAPVLRGGMLSAAGEPVQVRIPSQDDGDEPHIRVNKQNEVVESIDITCCCGRTVRIVCQYGADSEAATRG